MNKGDNMHTITQSAIVLASKEFKESEDLFNKMLIKSGLVSTIWTTSNIKKLFEIMEGKQIKCTQ